MAARVILDLCSGSGAWSEPYRAAGYDVRQVDLPTDLRLMHWPGPVHGILAAPPCTCFARSGAWVRRSDDDMRAALSVVDACLRLVATCRPAWWALENPVGTLRRWLGPPVCYFQPCDYGDPWTKRTCLWGRFTPPARCPVEPTLGSLAVRLPGRRRADRAKTPPGFAARFFQANP